MKKEMEAATEKPSTDSMLYDEAFDGYFSVNKSSVKITERPGQKKTDYTNPILFNGENVKCDGHYMVVNGIKYLFVQSREYAGYVSEEALTLL